MQDDTAVIRRSLTDRLDQLLSAYAPGCVIYQGAAYPFPASKADRGSCRVNLTGSRRGSWFRFSASIGGGSVELLAYLLTGNPKAYREAFAEARRFLGITRDEPDRAELIAREKASAAEQARREQEARKDRAAKERKRDSAQSVWDNSGVMDLTLGEDYLCETRRIPKSASGWPPQLRFHEGLLHPNGEVYPCIIARVDDVAGMLTSIWRIFLDPLTGDKADVPNSKMGLGPSAGGACRLGGSAKRIGIAEGVETAICAAAITGYRMPIWAALSTSGMVGIELPLEVEKVSIFPDGDRMIRRMGNEFVPDARPPGIRAAYELAGRLTQQGIKNVVNVPPFEADYADVLKSMRGAL